MEALKLKSSTYVVRLAKDEELFNAVLNFMKKNKFNSGFFYGLGAASQCLIGRYNPKKKDYDWQKIRRQMEVLAVVGNITRKGKDLFCHAHVVLSGKTFRAWGGHLKELYVNPTMEIYLKVFKKELKRDFDAQSGLYLIHKINNY